MKEASGEAVYSSIDNRHSFHCDTSLFMICHWVEKKQKGALRRHRREVQRDLYCVRRKAKRRSVHPQRADIKKACAAYHRSAAHTSPLILRFLVYQSKRVSISAMVKEETMASSLAFTVASINVRFFCCNSNTFSSMVS